MSWFAGRLGSRRTAALATGVTALISAVLVTVWALSQRSFLITKAKRLHGKREASPPPPTGSHSSDQRYDVLIVGAGWSGLAAAKTLLDSNGDQKEDNIRVRILEARHRLGGRSFTRYFNDDAWDGDSENVVASIDMGSQWIQGVRDNPMVDIAKGNNVPYAMSSHTDAVWDFHGQRVNTTVRRRIDRNWKDFLSYLQTRQSGDEQDTDIQSVLDDFVNLRHLPEDAVDGALGLQWMADTEISQEYASSLSALSLWWFDDDEELEGGDGYLGANIDGGYSRLVHAFAAHLRPHVQLQSVVTKIEYGDEWDGYARVTYLEDGQTREGPTSRVHVAFSKHVLVTVPLGVLQSGDIDFVPPIPRRKVEAINKLGVGLLDKCVLIWNNDILSSRNVTTLWPPDEAEWFELVSSKRGDQGLWTVFYNPNSLDDGALSTVLFAFVAGPYAQRAEGLTDDEVTQEALSSLRSMFASGNVTVPKPSLSLVSRWGADPYARGSYSFLPVGSNPRYRTRLGETVGSRLHFAGEATHRKFPATTQGAFLSGTDAAKKILLMLG